MYDYDDNAGPTTVDQYSSGHNSHIVGGGAVDNSSEFSNKGGQQQDPLLPIAALIDEIRHDDVDFRKKALLQLSHIAVGLGPQRTREELIPFLASEV